MHFYKSLKNLCFSDFDVCKIYIDQVKRIFRLDLEGVWLIQNKNEPKELGLGYIQISDYQEIKAKFFNSIKKTQGNASIEQIKELKEINDHKTGENSLKIFGFINDGCWLECEITGGELDAKFNGL